MLAEKIPDARAVALKEAKNFQQENAVPGGVMSGFPPETSGAVADLLARGHICREESSEGNCAATEFRAPGSRAHH